jgi:hypothetical protein
MGDLVSVVILAIIAVVLLLLGSAARRPRHGRTGDPLEDIRLDAEFDRNRTSAIETADRMDIHDQRY